MGVDYSTYIGPYLRCYNGEIAIPAFYRACTRDGCSEFSRELPQHSKFCSVCGSVIQNYSFTKTRPRINVVEVRLEMDEFLCELTATGSQIEPLVDFWILNRRIEGDPSLRINGYRNCAARSFQPSEIQAQIDWFELNATAQIALLKQRYGKENVQTCWGVITYAN